MKIEFKNETHKNLLFLDIENDRENLKQLSCILFTKKRHSLYELQGSLNFYIKDNEPLDSFFTHFTAIDKKFLEQNGISLQEGKELFLSFISNLQNLLIISHNIKNDTNILFKNNIDISKYDLYCTWTASKTIWKNNLKFNVEYLAAEQGYFLASPHDAYQDCWALVPIFAGLRENE